MRISDWSSDVCSSDLGNVPWLQLHGGHGQRCLMPLLRLSRLEHAPDEQASQHKGKGEDRCKDSANVWEARFRALDQAHVGSSEERRVGKECVSTCRSRGSPYHSTKKKQKEKKI